MEKKVIIVVATHKNYKMPKDLMYFPIQVGALGKEDIGYQRDDEGINISKLNPFFCELTGFYWAWKNLEADYTGLVHYRRHFSISSHSQDKIDAVIKYTDIEPDLGRIKVFVPTKRKYYIETLYSHYKHTHHIIHLDETRRIIAEKYPEYLDSFDKTVNKRWGYMFNMMIMEKDLLNEYCIWLFSILFELWDRLGQEGLSSFHSRYCGRVGEIIFNVWLAEQLRKGRLHKSEIKEIPIIYMEEVNWVKKICNFLKAKFAGRKYEMSI